MVNKKIRLVLPFGINTLFFAMPKQYYPLFVVKNNAVRYRSNVKW